jgi:hypothetical protein
VRKFVLPSTNQMKPTFWRIICKNLFYSHLENIFTALSRCVDQIPGFCGLAKWHKKLTTKYHILLDCLGFLITVWGLYIWQMMFTKLSIVFLPIFWFFLLDLFIFPLDYSLECVFKLGSSCAKLFD